MTNVNPTPPDPETNEALVTEENAGPGRIASANIYSAPESPANEDAAATRYIAVQVQQARIGLQRTRLLGLIALLLLGGEMIYITVRFSASLRPHAAAEIADGMILQQINDKGPDLANQLKQKIPEYIEQTPDYALREMPKYRISLEDRLEAELTHYCQATTQQLDKQLDTYLTDHKDDIKGMITAGNDPALTKRVGQDLKQQLLTYVKEKPQRGESLQDQLNTSLVALQGTAKTMHRLATARDLTGQEKQTRRALAILTQSLR